MKISKVYIKSFRGIPNECTLNFCGKDGNAKSVIIYGGNGSGKSSIVDAIEFNLQGRIERNPDVKNPKRPSLLSHVYKEPLSAYTKIDFDDNTSNERNVIVEKDEVNDRYVVNSSSDEAIEAFNEVSIALRRNEIIAYNNEDEKRRQFFVSSFIYSKQIEDQINNHTDYIKLENKIRNLGEEIFTKTSKLSNEIGYSVDEIEKNGEGAVNFIKRKFFPKSNELYALVESASKKINGAVAKSNNISEKKYKKYLELAQGIDELSEKKEKRRRELNKLRDTLRRENLPVFLKEEYYEKAGELLTQGFVKISELDYIEKIELSTGGETLNSLTIKIQLCNGKVVSPTQIFSEANYDLMILLLYISIIRVGIKKEKKAQVLIIDDVLQSIDANIRTKFMSYILKELKGWQLIITCHDRLWLTQLKHIFKHNGIQDCKEFHISNWSFETGPIIKEEKTNAVDESIQQALATNNMRIISSTTGFMLEKICNELTMNMHFSIERPEDDKYTLENLWKVIKARLKNDDILGPICEELDNVYYLRNAHGAHYNKWAESVSDAEVLRFADLVQKLYNGTFCPKCFSWIKKDGKHKGVCNCVDDSKIIVAIK